MMTPAEKAKETRRKHKEAQDQKEAEKLRAKEAIRKSCVEILESDEMTPGQKLEATKILHDLTKGR